MINNSIFFRFIRSQRRVQTGWLIIMILLMAGCGAVDGNIPAATSTPQPGETDTSVGLAVQETPTLGVPQKTIAGAEAVLVVQAGAEGYPISEMIYGMNWAEEPHLERMGLSLNGWGGNATTRYNWKIDTSNRASDWFFENIPNENPAPENLPDGSSSDQFVEKNIAAGVETVLTVPLIGWTPKAREIACGFNANLYGRQQFTDQWRPECGNGVNPDGKPVIGNNPTDTSIAIDETFVQDWIKYLVEKYGAAGEGGVTYYNLDNEPFLWSHTHRDVHPDPVGYDEIRDRTYQYAAAVKEIDPGAQLMGPVVWGWTAYFYSGIDAAAQGEFWRKPPDQKAHGDIPFVPWYLQQMQEYENTNGVRILDYLNLHYYAQAPGVALGQAGDAALQALRLRSTRSLWDPNYKDESWIDEPVRLIPRMHEWVDENYPGTKLAITEYNFGGLEHINGALAQAEVLGIFGRERLDLATLWAGPGAEQPGAYAFRIYRNYDGNGSQFGDVSLPAQSSMVNDLSIFAARRQPDGALTLMVINKTTAAITSQLVLDGGTAYSAAEVYRYSSADLTTIQKLDDLQPQADGWLHEFPAESITLLVFKP